MEIEIYGRTGGARLAAHGIRGCRYLPAETCGAQGLRCVARCSFRATPPHRHVGSFAYVCLACVQLQYSRRNRAKMTFSLRHYVYDTFRRKRRIDAAKNERRVAWCAHTVVRGRRMENWPVESYNFIRLGVAGSPPRPPSFAIAPFPDIDSSVPAAR